MLFVDNILHCHKIKRNLSFSSTFTADTVEGVDSHYPEKGYPDAVKAFSYAGFIANELVLDASGNTAGNLTEAQTKSVWDWDWYSY